MDSIARYLAEISTYPLLKKEEELALAVRIRDEGCTKSYQRLVACNLRLVIREARRRAETTDPWFMDFVQAGNQGLMKAAEKFNPELNNRFSTCAVPWIKQAIEVTEVKHSRHVRIPSNLHYAAGKVSRAKRDCPEDAEVAQSMREIGAVIPRVASLEEITTRMGDEQSGLSDSGFIDTKSPDPSAATNLDDLQKLLSTTLDCLSERERDIIIRRFGLGTEERESLEEVGVKHGLTRERIRQLVAASLAKMCMSFVKITNPEYYEKIMSLISPRDSEPQEEDYLSLLPEADDSEGDLGEGELIARAFEFQRALAATGFRIQDLE